MRIPASSTGSALDMSRYQYGCLYDGPQLFVGRGCVHQILWLDRRSNRVCFDIRKKPAAFEVGWGIRDHTVWLAASMLWVDVMLALSLASA